MSSPIFGRHSDVSRNPVGPVVLAPISGYRFRRHDVLKRCATDTHLLLNDRVGRL